MKTILLGFLLFNVLNTVAQPRYSVEYRTEYLSFIKHEGDSIRIYEWITSAAAPVYKLTVDDKLSRFRNIRSNKYYDRHTPFTEYYTDSSGAVFYPVASITEKALMAKDQPEGTWLFTTDTDSILGFPCRRATKLVGKEYVDVWYCWELTGGFGPFTYSGLPGTILRLETSDTRYSAINVNDEKEPVVFPETAVIDATEYKKISREKRMYRAGLLGKRVDPLEVPRITRFRY